MRAQRIVAGAASGLFATVLQTVASRVIAPRLPAAMRPPVFVPDEVARWLGARSARAPLMLHLGYGSGLGALYAASPLPQVRPVAAAGVLFGVGAWAMGFQGWVPALGILPRTTRRPPAQWAAPLLGHALYGVAAAAAFAALSATSPPA